MQEKIQAELEFIEWILLPENICKGSLWGCPKCGKIEIHSKADKDIKLYCSYHYRSYYGQPAEEYVTKLVRFSSKQEYDMFICLFSKKG